MTHIKAKQAAPATPLPLRFCPQSMYVDRAELSGRPLGEGEGYPRTNAGDWIILDAEGIGCASVNFRGKAKRGQTWNAPDAEGMALAAYLTEAANAYPRLMAERAELVAALREVLPLAERVTFGSHDNYAPSDSVIHARALLAKLGAV